MGACADNDKQRGTGDDWFYVNGSGRTKAGAEQLPVSCG